MLYIVVVVVIISSLVGEKGKGGLERGRQASKKVGEELGGKEEKRREEKRERRGEGKKRTLTPGRDCGWVYVCPVLMPDGGRVPI
jgi:hypothetical protein